MGADLRLLPAVSETASWNLCYQMFPRRSFSQTKEGFENILACVYLLQIFFSPFLI